jgi:hypothetical protein
MLSYEKPMIRQLQGGSMNKFTASALHQRQVKTEIAGG